MGSGDFAGRADQPAVIDPEAFRKSQAEFAHSFVDETYGLHFPQFVEALYEAGAENLIYRLIEHGWGDKTVLEVGELLGLVFEDGSWT